MHFLPVQHAEAQPVAYDTSAKAHPVEDVKPSESQAAGCAAYASGCVARTGRQAAALEAQVA